MKFTKSLRTPVLKNIREWLLLLNGEDPTFNIVTHAVLGTIKAESLQTHHVYSTLKRRGNGRSHVVSTWNIRGVFVRMLPILSNRGSFGHGIGNLFLTSKQMHF